MSKNVKEILSTQEFYETIENQTKPILIDFWATWCGPCKMQAPILHEFAEDLQDKILVLKVDVDIVEELAIKLNIRSIPTILVYVNGEEKEKSVGLTTKAQLSEMIIKYI